MLPYRCCPRQHNIDLRLRRGGCCRWASAADDDGTNRPFEHVVLDDFEAAPGSAPLDHLGFIETVDRFGQSVVIAVADTADRWLDGGLGKALCVLDGHVLRPTVAIMDQATPKSRTAIVERLFESRTKLACAILLARQPMIRLG
jgi:hypothetical protein